MVSIPILIVGNMLADGLSLADAAFCILIGFVILSVPGCFIALRGRDRGLPSALLAGEGLGVLGARMLHALLIVVSAVVWFGIQAAVCGASFSAMMENALGYAVSPRWSTALWGFIMTMSVIKGYQALKFLNFFIVSLLIAILGYIFFRVFTDQGFAPFLAYRPDTSLSLSAGITIVAGSWALGALTSGDYCRYGKARRDVILAYAAGLIPVALVVYLAGGIFRIASGTTDITRVLIQLGLPGSGLVILILSSWSINLYNAYSGGRGLSTLLGLGEKRMPLAIIATGFAGSLLGAAGILSRLPDFLMFFAFLIFPVMGVIIAADLSRAVKKTEGYMNKPRFRVPGLIAYGLGVLAAWLTGTVIPFFIPPVNGIIVAMAVYLALERFFPGKPD
jgi:cytosine permease